MAHNGTGTGERAERESGRQGAASGTTSGAGALIDKGREAAQSAKDVALHEIERAGEVARAHPDLLRIALLAGGGALWTLWHRRAQRRRTLALAAALDHLRRQARSEDLARLGRAARSAAEALPHALAEGVQHLPRLGQAAGERASAVARQAAGTVAQIDAGAVRRGLTRAAQRPDLVGAAMLLLGALAGRALARRR